MNQTHQLNIKTSPLPYHASLLSSPRPTQLQWITNSTASSSTTTQLITEFHPRDCGNQQSNHRRVSGISRSELPLLLLGPQTSGNCIIRSKKQPWVNIILKKEKEKNTCMQSSCPWFESTYTKR